MQVLVTFRHVDPSNALREHAEEKMRRVLKYLPRARDAHVVLSVDKRRHHAEVTLKASRSTLTASGETGDLYAAIDLAVDKITRQARKLGTRRKDRKFGGRVAGDVGSAPARPKPAAIRTERVTVKPMSVAEAVMQLNLLKSEFLLFKNAATETLSVICRRKDGQYRLIVPEVS